MSEPNNGNSNDDESISEQDVLDDEPKNILMGIISQLRQGGDLHKITLPAFILEPRSLLEKLCDFMVHPDLLISASKETDPALRFLGVTKFYLAGFHIRPKGVKKPYNPVLGEIFRCQWKLEDGSEAIYVAEQVSHHPPISAYFYAIPNHKIAIHGHVKTISKFYGNSAGTIMKGTCHIHFTDLKEEYVMTMPNFYAKGILFGKMTMELGDSCNISCEKTDYSATIEFKNKGFFSGSRNSVVGKVKKEKDTLYQISGKWSDEVFYNEMDGKKEGPKNTLFKVENLIPRPKIVSPESEQEERESRRLWQKVTVALIEKNMKIATEEKSKIENLQRNEAKARAAENILWKPRFFDALEEETFRFKHELIKDKNEEDPQTQMKHYQDIILEHVEQNLSAASFEDAQEEIN